MRDQNAIASLIKKHDTALEKLGGDLNDLLEKKMFLEDRETTLLQNMEVHQTIIKELKEIVGNGTKTRRSFNRPLDAVVQSADAIPLVLKILQMNGIREPKALTIPELFDLVLPHRPGWKKSFSSFSALMSTLHRSPIKGAKKIKIKKVGRRNMAFIKPPKRTPASK